MSVNPSVSVPSSVIHHEAALRVVRGALARAETLGIRVCVAVMDRGGTLAAFARMPGAFLISNDLAIRKAHAAVAVGLPSERVEQVLAQEAPRVREGLVAAGYCLIRGGEPLWVAEQLIGSVGVSGGSEAEDVECARAGAASLMG